MADEGNVTKTVIFVASFVLILGLLISGFDSITTGEETAVKNMRGYGFDANEFAAMDWWNNDEIGASPAGVWPTNVTSDSAFIGTHWTMPAETYALGANLAGGDINWASQTDAIPQDWSDGTNTGIHDVKLFALGGASIADVKWVIFHLGGGWDRWAKTINAQDILGNLRSMGDDSCKSQFSIDVGIKVTVVFVFSVPMGDVSYSLAHHTHYTVAVGQLPIDKTYNTGDLWGIIGQLLTFSLPDRGVPWITAIISGIVWAAILVAAFYMFNRLLDHIPFT